MADQPDKLSCGAVVVRKTESGWQTLMLRAYRNWDFPKGLCEPGESPLESATREIGEETGIAELSFEWGHRHTDTGPYNRGKVARYFLVRTGQEDVELGVSPEMGRPEHHEYRWLDFDSAYDIASPSNGPARSSAPD